jgi:hypothetical protein
MCTQNVIDDHTDDARDTTTYSNKVYHASVSCQRTASAGTASGAWDHHGSRLDIDTCQHPCTTSDTRAHKSNARHATALICTNAAKHAHVLPPTRPPVCCHTATCTTPGRRSQIRATPANNATSGGQKKHSIQSRCAGIISGICGEAVASRAEQSRSTKEESGRDHVCRRLDTCRRAPQRCAPFVLSGCSQEVEHLDLDPDTVQETEMMRSCSRKSHHLRGKSARTIADKRTNSATAARQRGRVAAVTSAVREGRAHGMEQRPIASSTFR